ncbi:MAG: phosphodiesterase [Pseudomonadota bacterium]
MTTVLHLSDTHLARTGALVSGRLNTHQPLERMVKRIQRAHTQWGTLDAILVTGDISDDGSPESYAQFRELMSPLGVPVYVIPGNHDAREPMRDAFVVDGYLPTTGHLNWRCHIGELTVVGLDTLVEGQGFGRLSEESLAYLESQLRAARKRPTLIALHHPPFRTGIAFMDAICLRNRAAFRDVMAHAQGDVRILCGHVHSLFVSDVGGHLAFSAPSTCSNFELDTRPEAPVGYFDRDDGGVLHRWDGSFTSVRIGPQPGTGPHPFN